MGHIEHSINTCTIMRTMQTSDAKITVGARPSMQVRDIHLSMGILDMSKRSFTSVAVGRALGSRWQQSAMICSSAV